MKNKLFHFQMEMKEVKAGDNGDVIIEGFASTPDLDRYRDIVDPKAFSDAVELYSKNPVILAQHDANRPVGIATSTKVTDKGFWIRASIKDEVTKKQLTDGLLRAFSIGYIPLESTLEHEDGTPFNAEKDSMWDNDLVRVIKRLDLVEISIVSTPANGYALFDLAKSLKSVGRQFDTKAFLSKQEKEAQAGEQTDEVKPGIDTETKVEEEKKPESTETTEPTATEAAPVATDTPAPPAATEEGKGTETDTTTTPTKGQQPTEEDEKGDEKAPADSPEAPKGEEGNAESKPKAEDEEEKSLTVNSLVAKALPELVQSGVLVEAKEAGQGVDLPKQVVGLMRKLVEEVVIQAKRANNAEDNATALQTKLDAIPTKSVLAPVGQFETAPSATVPSKKKADGGFLMDLIKNAR